jgi:hypothetical protein
LPESQKNGILPAMKTTLEIPDELYREAKAKAAMENRKIKDLVADGIRLILSQSASAVERPVGKRPSPFPLIRGKGGPLLKILDNKLIVQLQEEEDIERARRALGR